MANANEIKIKIAVDKNEATISIDELKKAFSLFQEQIEQSQNHLAEFFFGIQNFRFAITGIIHGFSKFTDAYIALEKANNKLLAASKLTDVSFSQLQIVAEETSRKFKLPTDIANELTIALSKLGKKAGDVTKTSQAIENLLNLAAAQGYGPEQALQAINQAILGIDEGTDKLFQKNPSVLYEEYAAKIGKSASKLSDMEKAQALLNAVIEYGGKVQGEYNRFLDSAAGSQLSFEASVKRLNQAIGQILINSFTPLFNSLGAIIEAFTRLPGIVQAAITGLGSLVTIFAALRISGFNLLAQSIIQFGSALRSAIIGVNSFKSAITALNASLGPAGWLAIGISSVITLLGIFGSKTQNATEKIKEFRGEAEKIYEEHLNFLKNQGYEEKQINNLKEKVREYVNEYQKINDIDELRRKQAQLEQNNDLSYLFNYKDSEEYEAQALALKIVLKLREREIQLKQKTGHLNEEEFKDLYELRKYEFESGRISLDQYKKFLEDRLTILKNNGKETTLEFYKISDEIKQITASRSVKEIEQEIKLLEVEKERIANLKDYEQDYEKQADLTVQEYNLQRQIYEKQIEIARITQNTEQLNILQKKLAYLKEELNLEKHRINLQNIEKQRALQKQLSEETRQLNQQQLILQIEIEEKEAINRAKTEEEKLNIQKLYALKRLQVEYDLQLELLEARYKELQDFKALEEAKKVLAEYYALKRKEIELKYFKTGIKSQKAEVGQAFNAMYLIGMRATGILQNALMNVFNNGIRGIKNFGQAFKQMLLELVAEIMAKAAVFALLTPFVPQSFGLGKLLFGFAEGGFTGGDEKEVRGVVHGGEWVAPAGMVRIFPDLFARLEALRLKGYAQGGFVDLAGINIERPISVNLTPLERKLDQLIKKDTNVYIESQLDAQKFIRKTVRPNLNLEERKRIK